MSNEELVKQIQNGINVTENMKELYCRNLSIIRQFIKPFSYYEEMEDLEQESYFGLLDAVNKYDEEKGVKFMTYARYWILQGVQRHINTAAYCIRLPDYQRDKVRAFNRYMQDYEKEHAQKPDNPQISKDLGYSIEQIEEMKRLSMTMKSLDEDIKDNEDGSAISFGSTMPDKLCNVEDEVLEREYTRQLRRDVRCAVDDCLVGQEREAIKEIYFNGKSLRQAGKKMGVSYQWVNERKKSALKKLKVKSKKLLYQYIEIEPEMYRGTFSKFRQTNTSSVEYIVLKRQEIRDRLCGTMVGEESGC